MKVASVVAAGLLLCMLLPSPIQANFEKPKYCVGRDGKHYLRGEHYDYKNKETETCIRFTCVRKGKKLKMSKKKIPCVEPPPNLTANVTALEASVKSLQASFLSLQTSVESILEMVIALQFRSSQLETNVTTNIDSININKDDISTNVASLATKCDASSCTSLQTTATDIESCLADITSSACPSPPSGKTSVAGGISGNTAALADKCDASTCLDIQTTVENLETNVTTNKDSININKYDISTNVASLATKCDSSSCTNLQTSATDIESCLADITSSACPSPPSGKTSVAGGISGNIAALADKCDASTCSGIQTIVESLEGCCNTSSTPTLPPTTTPIGVVGQWSSWSSCTATCGNATKTRTRTCRIAPCQPFDKEETVKCHLPICGDNTFGERCFFEDTHITFHDFGQNRHNQNQKPEWILSDQGRTLKSFFNTRPSAGLTNLGNISNPVSFSGRVFSTANDNDVMGMVFGYWNETNFFVVASSREGGPTNWYVGRLHATCNQSCASEKTISNAIWSPHDHPEDITVLANASTAWQHNEKYNFTICFNPSMLLLNVNVTLEDGMDTILQTGTISAKTNDSDVDAISRQGGFIGVYVDSQADTTWDNLDCHDCGLDEFGPTLIHTDSNFEYYKVPVPESSKMTSATVLSACASYGMKPQCLFAKNDSIYIDSNCIRVEDCEDVDGCPRVLSNLLCSTLDPRKCETTINVFWYMYNWISGSACGVTSGSFCSIGNSYTSTSNTQYFAACIKPIAWTVIQRRGLFGNSEDYFYRDFSDYEIGFGSVDGEFWLGLKNIAGLTSSGSWELQVDLTDWDGTEYQAIYDRFSVGPSPTYQLDVSGFQDAKSTLGDSLRYHSGMNFTTRDNDQDNWGDNCASDHRKGGWWYNACANSNLNGLNFGYQENNSYTGIVWYHGKDRGNSHHRNFQASVIKMKKVNV